MVLHSPLPWTIVRHSTPYGEWIMDAASGMVAIGFSHTDEGLLLHAPNLLHAIEAAVVAMDAGRLVAAGAFAVAVGLLLTQ